MFYLDTSVLVSALASESATSRVQSWLQANEQGQFWVSPWCVTEFNSALSMKLRLNVISFDNRKKIVAELNHLLTGQIMQFEVKRSDFMSAARYAAQHQLNLRSGDALHLAIAANNGAVLCTLDQRLFDAGMSAGIPSVMP